MDGSNAEKSTYKLVVISDTHHDFVRLNKLLPIINSADYLIFCGDGANDILQIHGRITVPLVCVKGNCDQGSNIKFTDLACASFGNTRALVTHGHNLGVRQGTAQLTGMAKMKDCRLAFFGHTHKYYDKIENGVHLINPGALCTGSYALVVGDGDDFISKQCII